MSAWKKIRYLAEAIGVEAVAKSISLLPRKSCAALAKSVGRLAFRFDRRGRAVALANIEAAFGDFFSADDRTRIARESYENFARTFFDLFWSSRLNARNFSEHIHLENFERVRELQAQKRGAVLMCVHSGNFEWASLVFGFGGAPTMIVAESFKNPRLGPIFNGLREVSGHQIIAQENSMIRLLKQVKRGGLSGMLIDLNVQPTQAATVIDTFGMKMCVTILQAVLAQRAGTALVPVESVPLDDGSCRVVVHEPLSFAPDASLQQIAQGCWDFFEPMIRAHPERWMWSYKHWRYQPKEAAKESPRAYPFYANASAKFEKLLRSSAQPEISRRRKI